MKIFSVYFFVAVAFLMTACSEENPRPRIPFPGQSVGTGGWSIPSEQVYDGGPGKDGIPALEDPKMITADQVQGLADDELIVGVEIDGEARAYTHNVLDWHEIINDQIGTIPYAVSYCPLTGTATNWSRNMGGEITTFGVSGLLYNSNLIPYDRKTGSNWSQMLSRSVYGDLIGRAAELVPVIETTWRTWKEMYPNTLVVSTDTGFDKPYGSYPYITSSGFDYRTEPFLIFPVTHDNDRLPKKERVLGVEINGESSAYRFKDFEGDIILRTDNLGIRDIVVVGSSNYNFLTAFRATLDDATRLEFSPLSAEDLPQLMKDQLGNTWDVFGRSVSGPNKGEQLPRVRSYIGYWFAWAAFKPDIEIASF